MSTLKFRRFSKPAVLKQIGRELLGRFLKKFEHELASGKVPAPSPKLADGKYFRALARWLMAPETLPGDLTEALYVIDEMATPEGGERLRGALEAEEPPVPISEESSHEDLALQVWLERPDLLQRKHLEQSLFRLSAFEYHGTKAAKGKRPPLKLPTELTRCALEGALDSWFAKHGRGRGTTKVDVHPIDGEHWFVIHHGGVYARAPAVQGDRVQVVNFRPETYDVVVYDPASDEIRINADTRGVRQLYRRKFGYYLFGNESYFSERMRYTLEPLRRDGEAALSAADIQGLGRIALRELEVSLGGEHNEVVIRQADDLFACCPAGPRRDGLMPQGARIERATFEITFGDSGKARRVQVRQPNHLKLGRHCDVHLVNRWLSRRGFRTTVAGDA